MCAPRGRPRRSSGSRAAVAVWRPAEVDAALARLELLYAVVYSFGGIPLLYMGDEIAMLNDAELGERPEPCRRQPLAASPADGLGRRGPPARARHRRGPDVRRAPGAGRGAAIDTGARSDADTTVLPVENSHVLAYVRRPSARRAGAGTGMLQRHWEEIDVGILDRAGLSRSSAHPLVARPSRGLRRPASASAMGLRLVDIELIGADSRREALHRVTNKPAGGQAQRHVGARCQDRVMDQRAHFVTSRHLGSRRRPAVLRRRSSGGPRCSMLRARSSSSRSARA